jgi:hypothetical protein
MIDGPDQCGVANSAAAGVTERGGRRLLAMTAVIWHNHAPANR